MKRISRNGTTPDNAVRVFIQGADGRWRFWGAIHPFGCQRKARQLAMTRRRTVELQYPRGAVRRVMKSGRIMRLRELHRRRPYTRNK